MNTRDANDRDAVGRSGNLGRVPPYLLILVIALAIAVLAWIQPVSATDADAGLALVAAQALVEHGTFDLNVYRDLNGDLDGDLGRRLHYDLETDYRVQRKRDGTRPYLGFGVTLLLAPIVGFTKLLGFDMLNPAHEAGLQNLLSAIACGVVYVLLVRLGRCFLRLGPSLALAAIFQLASPLTSTLATALWNVDLSIPLMLVVLIALVRYEQGHRPMPWLLVGLVLPLALLSRPTTAFLILGLIVFMLLRVGWPPRLIALLSLLAAVFLVWLDNLPVTLAPVYYAPQRLLGLTPLHEGLPAILLSPSRGLLVFCPFLLPLLMAAWCARRYLLPSPIAMLCGVWVLTQTLALATKGRWWGGHSFGPRLLTELLLPAFLIAAMLLARSFVGRRGLVLAGLALAAPSLAIHSGQGLFNTATWRWNAWPSIDQAPELLFSWRYPQFLATEKQLVARETAWRSGRLKPIAPGQTAGPLDERVVFDGWWEAEQGWRWSRDDRPRICFRTCEIDPERWYALRIDLGALGHQVVTFELAGVTLGSFEVADFAPQILRLPVAGRLLAISQVRCLVAAPSAPRRASREDPRVLAINFRALRFDPLPNRPVVLWTDDAAFMDGWSAAESVMRWSVGHQARFAISTRGLDRQAPHHLEIAALGHGEQTMHVRLVDGASLTTQKVLAEPAIYRLPLPADALAGKDVLVIELELPDARRPLAADSRLLGIALERVRIVPEPS